MSVSVTIIIPVYNVEKYLCKCLDSVVSQSIESKEIIIVNDGSSDNSGNIIKDYKNRYPDLIIIDKKNGGLASARNAGIRVATGEFVGFVDSDDFIHKDMYKNLYEKANDKKCDIVMCGHVRVFDDQEETYSYKYDEGRVYGSREIIRDFLTHKISLSCCDKLFRKELFIENNLYFSEGKLNEDIQVVFGLILNSHTICFDRATYYHYYQRSGSITKKIKLNFIIDMLSSLENIKYQLIEKNKYITFQKEFMSFFCSYVGTSNMNFYRYLCSCDNCNSDIEIAKCKELLISYNKCIKITEILTNHCLDCKNKIKVILLKLGVLKSFISLGLIR